MRVLARVVWWAAARVSDATSLAIRSRNTLCDVTYGMTTRLQLLAVDLRAVARRIEEAAR